MTTIISGSNETIFSGKDELADHLLRKVLENKNRKIGTEWEIFFVDKNDKAISRADGQRAFQEFKKIFTFNGYKTSYTHEKSTNGSSTIIALDIEGIGSISPEMGHQFEFSCSVSKDHEEIKEKNEEFYRIAVEVAKRLNYTPVFKGHIPDYVDNTEGSYRSRSLEWRNYFDRRFGSGAVFVREALEATASTQVTIDSGAEKFHEFFKTLLLIEPALTLHYANSDRPHVSIQRLPAAHMQPVVDVWNAKTAKEAVSIIVDRLMDVEVPFLPDPKHPSVYKAEPLVGNRPPSIRDLMMQGRLNEKTLNNAGGFLLARPAIRRFSQALIELRGVDSQQTPDKVAELAQRVMTIVYDDEVRQQLLKSYAHLTTGDIQALHNASSMSKHEDAMNMQVAGMKVEDFVQDIIERGQKAPVLNHQRNWGRRFSAYSLQHAAVS